MIFTGDKVKLKQWHIAEHQWPFRTASGKKHAVWFCLALCALGELILVNCHNIIHNDFAFITAHAVFPLETDSF